MSQVAFLDNLLKEYLVFRGFSSTLKTLDQEQKTEKDQSFRAEKLLESFNQSIQSHDLVALRSLWTHLDSNLFSKLEHTYATAVKKLENSLLKLYLVTAYAQNRADKINEFFSKLAADLQQQSEWKDWFYFPFCRNAEESPTFALYFSKQWQDTLQLSLRNFLTTIYQCLPQPTFVHAEYEAAHIRRLQEENALLKTRLQQITSDSNQNLNAATSEASSNRRRASYKPHQSLSDILPFDVSPPGHLVDDFSVISSEVNIVAQASDAQARGLRMLIRNIGSGGSPDTGGRKDASNGGNNEKSNKRRSGSVGRNWI
ncbi:WD repeat-containing protein 91 isoform X1 [Eurosta solidaginis]|uniref:WD repeat-containing protein 91 isoform X1 n=1 Tax=Eurosta solidaginis TaxID=178769 RepID=UPI0035308CA9